MTALTEQKKKKKKLYIHLYLRPFCVLPRSGTGLGVVVR